MTSVEFHSVTSSLYMPKFKKENIPITVSGNTRTTFGES